MMLSPGTSYTMTRKELKAQLMEYGEFQFFNGDMYDIKSKHLGAGVYKVWLTPRKIVLKKRTKEPTT